MKNSEKSAFPISGIAFSDKYEGLTKREHFAGLAMQGLVSNHDWAKTMVATDDWDDFVKRATSGAVELADAILAELEKPKP